MHPAYGSQKLCDIAHDVKDEAKRILSIGELEDKL